MLFRSETGKVTAIGGFVTDITSQKRAMEATEAAKLSAEDLEAVGAYLAGL